MVPTWVPLPQFAPSEHHRHHHHLIAGLFLWFCVRSCHVQRHDLRRDGESCVTRPSESRVQDHGAIVQTRLPRSNQLFHYDTKNAH